MKSSGNCWFLRFLLIEFLLINFFVNGWIGNYLNRMDIFARNMISADIADANALLKINTRDLVEMGFLKTTCHDLEFTLEDDTILNFWLESSCNTPNTTIWLEIPRLYSDEEITIFMYFNDDNKDYSSSLSWGTNRFGFFKNSDCEPPVGIPWSSVVSGRLFMGTNGNEQLDEGSSKHTHMTTTMLPFSTDFEIVGIRYNSGTNSIGISQTDHHHMVTFGDNVATSPHTPPSRLYLACYGDEMGPLSPVDTGIIGIFDDLTYRDGWEDGELGVNGKEEFVSGASGRTSIGKAMGSKTHDHEFVFDNSEVSSELWVTPDILTPLNGLLYSSLRGHDHGSGSSAFQPCISSVASNEFPCQYLNLRVLTVKMENVFVPGLITFHTCVGWECFLEDPPLGWDNYDGLHSRFLRATRDPLKIGKTCGDISEFHDHKFVCNTSSDPGGFFNQKKSVIPSETYNEEHYHTFSGTVPEAQVTPPHVKIRFVKRKLENETLLNPSGRIIRVPCFGDDDVMDTGCGIHGSCVAVDVCRCDEGYYGVHCNITECHGVLQNRSDSCGLGRGVCVGLNTCTCNDTFYGENCEITTCFDTFSNDTSNVCSSGHGTCVAFDVCDCFSNYTSPNCSFFHCFGIPKNDTSGEVCSGHGVCVDLDVCSCHENYTYSSNCGIWECYGRLSNYTEENGVTDGMIGVCSGHGECYDHDSCNCSKRYPGDYCEQWSCDDKYGLDDACNGNGICWDWDYCVCFQGYSDAEVTYCYDYSCNGFHFTETTKVCNLRGECIAPDLCRCEGNYIGDDCETFECGGMDKDDPNVCNGRGKCKKPGECKCDKNWSGEICDYDVGLAVGLGVSLPIVGMTTLALLIIGTGCLACLLVGGFVCFVCVFIVCVIGLLSAVLSQKRRLKKFGKLRNLDLLLEEQQLETSGDDRMAKLKINSSLFEVDFDQIKMISVIGEGGSESTVYKAQWANQIIAFKCFKTNTLCSSQRSFDEFEKEVSILSSVSHPHVIRFFGASLKPPRVGILMEFCEKGDMIRFFFHEHLEDGYHWDGKIRMCKEICLAMDYLHQRNIIHRDLKLENVLVDSDDRSKVMDFGLSKLVNRMSQAKTQRVGTNIYIAPEVILHSRYNQMCDVFSFSIMLFIIITGNRWPYGRDASLVELKVAQDPTYRPNVRELDEKYPEKKAAANWLKKIVQVCWNQDPNKRMSFKEISNFLIMCETINEEQSTAVIDSLMKSIDDVELQSSSDPGTSGGDLYNDTLRNSSGGIKQRLGSRSAKKELLQYIQQLVAENQKLSVQLEKSEEEKNKIEDELGFVIQDLRKKNKGLKTRVEELELEKNF